MSGGAVFRRKVTSGISASSCGLTPLALAPASQKKAIDFAIADDRIPYVTFLLPPSRKKLGALKRLGAKHIGEIDYDGATFLKYRLETV